ncbi:MAG: hypothetical protein ACU0CL_03195, partial [Paracoccus sp. (in: a-proteobacteria)]|uniref:hypothetical protein n=1 Tax=Paracoccus sp. TaxID=267 RepID=UPI00405A1314
TGLRDSTLSIRMLPIEMVFGKFRRVVRDLSAELGKDVALVTEGARPRSTRPSSTACQNPSST